ncbi:MAG: membrane protein insertase YidC [Acidimicrobiales bacterium]
MAGLLAYFYQLVPNYAMAITLLTLAVMLVLAPLTVKSTRSMLAMQRLQPEMKKLQAKYKGDRQKLNEEMMAFYKEHAISPLGGCLPMILQLPVFFIMYDVIQGLTHVVNGHPSPRYIGHSTLLYHHLVAGGGQMQSLGIDLAKSITSVHGGLARTLPFIGLVALAVILQYVQMRQMNGRNPQANANPQAAMLQKIMPIVFVFIYISIPAGVNIYFVISSLFRIGQQELMYRFDPKVNVAVQPGGVLEVESVDGSPSKKRPGDGSTKAIANGSNGSSSSGDRPGARKGGLFAALAERAAAAQAERAGPGGAKSPAPARIPSGKWAQTKNGNGSRPFSTAGPNANGSRREAANGAGRAESNGRGGANGSDAGVSRPPPSRKSNSRSQAKRARRAR